MKKNILFSLTMKTLILNPLIMTLKVFMNQKKNYLDVDKGMPSAFIFLSV